ncbi:branched-chain amino acid ABC transporter permease [Calidithermus timidus]|jgi:branched-chain amino acid transport system permease protein|uniref:branched-chain amino acid ABC transporter permease n=1 Tax=Calidithermus timidus TaxID=307124 RepID=UPI000370D17D|nr:branched-chain amino acid ABC transporter permease [Calidithermus timidus]
MDLSLLPQFLITGLSTGALYALIALGFVLVYRATSVVNFAIGEFLLVGAYLVYTFNVPPFNFPLPLAMLTALPAAFLFGLLIERGFVRPLLGRNVVAVIMATIGLVATLDGTAQLVWGADQKAYNGALPGQPIILGSLVLTARSIWGIAVGIGVALLLIALLRYSRYGVMIRAVSESETAALALGINAPRMVGIVWGLSAALAALGGALLASASGPGFHVVALGLMVFPVAILGGMDSVPGAVVAGLLLGVVQALSTAYLEGSLPGITEAIPFVIVLLVLLLRPYGLFGQSRIERV